MKHRGSFPIGCTPLADRHNGQRDKRTNERTNGRSVGRTDGRRDASLRPSVRSLDGVSHKENMIVELIMIWLPLCRIYIAYMHIGLTVKLLNAWLSYK